MSIYLGDKLISGVATPVQPTRNIGQIIQSLLPLTDAGLHLLDGALIDGNGIYKAFVDYISNLYNSETPTVVQKYVKDQYIPLPTFTANTTNGITISDSRSNTTVLQAIFNETNNYNQIGAWSTYWVNIDYGQNTIIDSYEITADNSGGAEYPSAWTLQASIDGSNWDVLDTKAGITFSTNQKRTFYINANSAYKQYRLVFTDGVLSSSNGELKRLSFNAYTPKVVPTIEGTFFATEEQWQQSVSTYGVCGKFVYNATNNTVRLPKVGNYLYTKPFAETASVAGDGKALGLTNTKYNFGMIANNNTCNNQMFQLNAYGAELGSTATNNASSLTNSDYVIGVTTDSTKSGLEADLSNITTPLEGYYYIVIATGTKTDVEVNIDNVVTDLNGKADRDLTNVVDAMSASAKSYFAGLGMPSSKYNELSIGASGSSYTAPAAGYFLIKAHCAKDNEKLRFENRATGFQTQTRSTAANGYVANTIKARKDDVIYLDYDSTLSNPSLRFYYAEGEI